MKSTIEWWQSINLLIRIVIGLCVGAILGVMIPDNSLVPMFGKVFVGLLKGVAPVLVFIMLYVIGTLLAAASAVLFSTVFPVTMTLTDAVSDAAPSGIGQVLSTIITNMVANPVAALMNANYVGILTWAIIFGLAFKKLANDSTRKVISDFASVVAKAVAWIIQVAPFGIMGLVFSSVAESGLAIFADYGVLLAVLVGTMFVMAFIVNPLIGYIFLKRNPYPLVFRCLKGSGVTAFFTRSSAANIPVNMTLCKKLGLDEDFYSVSVPLGATINMEGAAITITVMTLAVAHTLGIQVDIPTAIILSVLATVGACGASGVAGGSLLLIPMACSLFGISNDIAMQAVGVGFIIGVVQDSCETALNSSSDALFAAIAEFHDRMKQGKKVEF